MHLLLTNDDGYHADGLQALASAAQSLGYEVTIIAPSEEQSMCGHRVTTYRSLTLVERSQHHYTLDGTPADCVRVALFGLNLRPDAVLSGINHGGNLGQDVVISGTCAAAREAAYHGVAAVAFSHYLIKDLPLDWTRITCWLQILLPALLSRSSDRHRWLNVNFPHLPPAVTELPPLITTVPEVHPLPVSYDLSSTAAGSTSLRYSGRYADRTHREGSDVHTVFGGAISLTEFGLL